MGRYAVQYISGNVVRYVCSVCNCVECVDVLQSVSTPKDEKSLIALKDFGGLIYPSDDVCKLLQSAEKVLRNETGSGGISRPAKLLLHIFSCKLKKCKI